MSDDLVKRLRSLGSAGPGRISFLASEDAMKAASRIEKLEAANLKQSLITVDHLSRIEQLEAALRKIEYLDRPQVRGLPRRIEIGEIARKALEGKDE